MHFMKELFLLYEYKFLLIEEKNYNRWRNWVNSCYEWSFIVLDFTALSFYYIAKVNFRAFQLFHKSFKMYPEL